ncbi:tetratricopeptide repeat protein [Spirosoma pomorum]
MKNSLNISLYNPHEQGKENLISQFVVRGKTFNRIFNDIKDSKMKYPEQHYLIEGQRGMGKTTLLLRLAYEVENNKNLCEWLLPIVLKEEAYYSVTSLTKLWEEVARHLSDRIEFAELIYEIENIEITEDKYEEYSFSLLIKYLTKNKKKILLLVDNLNEIFQIFSEKEGQRFREVLLTCTHIRFIGASSITLEAFYNYKEAFFDFFKVVSLRGLNYKETKDLINYLGKSYSQETKTNEIISKESERLNTLLLLTGGVIRTIILLFEIFVEQLVGNTLNDLERLLDRVTPFYKHRMDDLNPTQRPIVHIIALNWDAMRINEISSKAKISEEETTKILSELEKVYIVESKVEKGQKDYYQLRERFFNIWYLMRMSRNNNKVIWLVKFLASWYSRNEIKRSATMHFKALDLGLFNPEIAAIVTNALVLTEKLDFQTEHQLISKTRSYVSQKNTSFSNITLISEKEKLEQAKEKYYKGEKEDAIKMIHTKRGSSESLLGHLYNEVNEFDKAIEHFSKIIDKNNSVRAWNGLANSYSYINNYSKAEECYKKAIEIDNEYTGALENLALLYIKLENKEKAIECYQKATDIDKDCITAWISLAELYYDTKEYDKAIYNFEKATQIDHEYLDALEGLGRTYCTINNYSRAEDYYLRAIEIDDKYTIVWTNLGVLYYNVKNYNEAKNCYLNAIKFGGSESVFEWENLGKVYFQLKDYDQAKECYQNANKLLPNSIGILYNLGEVNEKLGDYPEALNYYLRAESNSSDIYPLIKYKLSCLKLISYKNKESWNKAFEILQEVSKPLSIRMDYMNNVTTSGEDILPFIDQDKVYVSVINLPFYNNYKIYRLNLITDQNIQFYILSNLYNHFILNKTNIPLYSTSSIDFSINPSNLMNYIMFFFDCVAGRHGKFHIVRDINDIPWWDGVFISQEIKDKISLNLAPPEYLGLTNDDYIMRCCMTFKDSLFRSTARVSRIDGIISIIDEELILERLPIKEVDPDGEIMDINHYEKIVESNPNDYQAICLLGDLYANNLHDYFIAKEYYIKAININHEYTLAQRGLGNVYNSLKNYNEAKHYYLNAIKYGDHESASLLAWMCFENKLDKQTALKYALMNNDNTYSTYVLSSILLWNNQSDKALEKANNFLHDELFIRSMKKELLNYLILLCAKGQITFTQEYLENSAFQVLEKYKPLYYAVLKLLNHQEFLRMPNELEQIVDEIIATIKKIEIEYN